MKSLQDKYTRNKTRKLTVLETHKRSSISTNECLTSHNNSETVCDNNNCDKSSTISMQKDGNCFFRCISSYLHNTEVYHENIRHEVTNTLSKNKEFYSQLIDGDFDQHINNMEQTNGHTNTWATEAEIMAASETFNCEIFIKTIVDGNFSWIRHSIKPNCDHDIPYISILHENQHFS